MRPGQAKKKAKNTARKSTGGRAPRRGSGTSRPLGTDRMGDALTLAQISRERAMPQMREDHIGSGREHEPCRRSGSTRRVPTCSLPSFPSRA